MIQATGYTKVFHMIAIEYGSRVGVRLARKRQSTSRSQRRYEVFHGFGFLSTAAQLSSWLVRKYFLRHNDSLL